MAVNPDPHNAAAIFGLPSPIVSQDGSVPQASPRLAPNKAKAAKVPSSLRKALGDAFIADVFTDWQIWGPVVIEKMRLEDPTAYAKMVSAILPKEVALTRETPLAELTDEQLDAVYASLVDITPTEPQGAEPNALAQLAAPTAEPTSPIGLESESREGKENPCGAEITD